MQQMHEPEERAYNEGYQTLPVYPEDKNRQSFEEYAGERDRPHYRSNEGEKQKPRLISGAEHIQRGLARAMLAITSALLALSIPLLIVSITYLVYVGLDAGETTHRAIAAIVLAVLVMLIAIAGFICSIIQWKQIEKKLSGSEERTPSE